jgi:U3 small nucleolar RNA-associated protein 19
VVLPKGCSVRISSVYRQRPPQQQSRKCLKAPIPLSPSALNLLAYLEALQDLPSQSSQITSFWIAEFGSSKIEEGEEGEDQIGTDDWRLAFRGEDGEQNEVSPAEGRETERNYQLSTTRAVRSANSHRSQFTTCWFTILPHLRGSEAASVRVLDILQYGVMPYLTRPIQLLDWVSGCVEYGQ